MFRRLLFILALLMLTLVTVSAQYAKPDPGGLVVSARASESVALFGTIEPTSARVPEAAPLPRQKDYTSAILSFCMAVFVLATFFVLYLGKPRDPKSKSLKVDAIMTFFTGRLAKMTKPPLLK